jgi:adenine-specific DNA-methyltransferase
MQLNAEDKNNRKFILVQLPELVDEKSEARKAHYQTICEIGKERIRRAGKQIKEETGTDIDYGFRVFKVDSSNMADVYYRAQDVTQEQMMEMFTENIKEGRIPEDLLFQSMLELGIPLSSPIEEITIDGKKVFSVEDGYLLACFDDKVSDVTITEIAKRQPFYAIFRDSSLENDAVMANFEQIFATYSPQTERKVL